MAVFGKTHSYPARTPATGLLNFCCRVILPGRPFLRRVIDLTIGLKQPHHRKKLSRGATEDLKLWLFFLEQFNGKWFFLQEQWISSSVMQLYTDAAAKLGFGGMFNTHWFFGTFPPAWSKLNIVTLELLPIVVAVKLWGQRWHTQCIEFMTDNMTLVHIINRQTSKEKDVMILVCALVFFCLKFNINFRAKNIPGKHNHLTDALSRLQIDKFRHMAQGADLDPTPIVQLPPFLDWNTWQQI